MPYFTLNRDWVLSGFGHVINFYKGEETWVPPLLVSAAVAIGAQAVDGDNPDPLPPEDPLPSVPPEPDEPEAGPDPLDAAGLVVVVLDFVDDFDDDFGTVEDVPYLPEPFHGSGTDLAFGNLAGGSNFRTGVPSSASAMNPRHTFAAVAPPWTRPPFMLMLTAGLPIQTAVDSCGVNPTNHTSVFLPPSTSVVPVLPAAGRRSGRAPAE